MSATQNNEPHNQPTPVAQQDWFSIACNILAPGTRHHNTITVALDWDAFDKLEAHGWEYRAWWVDPTTRKHVEQRAKDSRLHEQRSRRLLDGSSATCFPPSGGERPILMLCPNCQGRGWTLVTDHENGDAHQLDCERCDASGRVPRPFSPLPAGLTAEDFTGSAGAGPVEAPF